MEKAAQPSIEIPTALPGFEDEDAREKLLVETLITESDIDSDNEDIGDVVDEKNKPKKRRWQLMRTIVGFGVFVGVLALALSWFFGMGLFAESKAQPVSRNAPKGAPSLPATEDEKLRMALSMVAANAPKNNETSGGRTDPEGMSSTSEPSVSAKSSVNELRVDGGGPMKAPSGADETSYVLPRTSDTTAQKWSESETSKQQMEKKETPAPTLLRTESSVDAPGRSLFFGVTRKSPAPSSSERISENTVSAIPAKEAQRGGMTFGTVLPVRLIGSIYTLKNSSGVVRLELTRSIEGKDYSYPAGTVLIGNARGGESSRAFVTVIGLIDPVSGELVKFGGELLGKDGASGIEGKRRRLTSQWARFFNGLRETASTVLGSVGALRSGGTVILSEPIRRGSESMSEDLSSALLGNGKENTFIEVPAGANGYVLVTDLPDTSAGTAYIQKTGANGK